MIGTLLADNFKMRLTCRKAARLQAKDPLMDSVLGDGSSGNNITLIEEECR